MHVSGVSTCSSTLIAAVLFHSGIQSQIPNTGSLSTADVFLLINYGVTVGCASLCCNLFIVRLIVAGESHQLGCHSHHCYGKQFGSHQERPRRPYLLHNTDIWADSQYRCCTVIYHILQGHSLVLNKANY